MTFPHIHRSSLHALSPLSPPLYSSIRGCQRGFWQPYQLSLAPSQSKRPTQSPARASVSSVSAMTPFAAALEPALLARACARGIVPRTPCACRPARSSFSLLSAPQTECRPCPCPCVRLLAVAPRVSWPRDGHGDVARARRQLDAQRGSAAAAAAAATRLRQRWGGAGTLSGRLTHGLSGQRWCTGTDDDRG